MICDLVPSYREVNNPVPIPTFLRKTKVASAEPISLEPDPCVVEASTRKNLAWSRGLGLKLSPVKARGDCKRVKIIPTLPCSSYHSTID